MRLLDLLTNKGFAREKIKGIVDSNPHKDGRVLHGLPVYAKERFFAERQEDCSDIIISSAAFEHEIYEELQPVLPERVQLIRLYDGKLGCQVPL
ncbi:hypothetical protein HM1_1236 [Heliomicrobium modesticaldum Ice1]|uniref:Uncharacterized protein n=1 Tax=Heliobacterium modesticaldum (strain ATCC 51547 / Ice1) TaxID=498761 RepID=B0TH15_HELMI|nr:hypothetical protein [Heliomicrobium modesticaldum]ABZ83340.1 hypothetical protein HM1_1236 [Heliomicrobium modesticaldum Ice1]